MDLTTLYYDPMPGVPVHPELNWTARFLTTSITLFDHHGIMEVGGVNLGDVEFNLICDKIDLGERTEPHALFGLGMQMGQSRPILEQLYSTGKIDDLSFSLYLQPSWKTPSGLLRLGGADPQRYVGQMEYFRVAPGHEWALYINYVDINDHRVPAFGDKALIDTGSNFMMIPAKYWQAFRQYLQRDNVTIPSPNQVEGPLEMPCGGLPALPDVHLGIRSAIKTSFRFTVEPSIFADTSAQRHCTLKLTKSLDDLWIIPNFALRGNYLHFRPQGLGDYKKPLIGFAKLRTQRKG
ncbi:hypothetical protein FOL47_005208 [Perkinsus chesapeaki]|uniref:Peptidase A1 domain-containing protein n=1 Tax=Perkinsus chesapeaki TaxID=330153 RepID=A0A7J6LYB6_PERCH|nr:hypothetical protein FOL47_005208 [Perkinsus chesapeaki]